MSEQHSSLRQRPSRVFPSMARWERSIAAGVKNGDVTRGISLLRSGSAAYRATGTEMWTPHNTTLLAQACEIAGQIEEALAILDDALQIVERMRARWFEGELNRNKGRLL